MFVLALISILGAASGSADDVQVTPIAHASFILEWDGKVIHVDPTGRGDYQGRPAADLVLITDIHGDHADPGQVVAVSNEDTIVVAPESVREMVPQARTLANGETLVVAGIEIEAVPMYNLTRGPEPGKLYHPRGRGNGYVLTLDSTRVYISGDTACIPEMRALENIDVAFVCMNLPYTMPPEEAAECVNAFRPKVVYPYHYRGSDLEVFKKGVTAPGTEVRVLDWY